MIEHIFFTTTINNKLVGIVRTNADGSRSSIPLDEANTDYQQYLAWVAEGNTAEELNPNGD